MARKRPADDVPIQPLTEAERFKVRTEPLLDAILQAAEAHGEESEPEMQVGDLEQALRVAWELLPGAERLKMVESFEVKEILSWLPEREPPG